MGEGSDQDAVNQLQKKGNLNGDHHPHPASIAVRMCKRRPSCLCSVNGFNRHRCDIRYEDAVKVIIRRMVG